MAILFKTLIIAVLVQLATIVNGNEYPQVQIGKGILRGKYMSTKDNVKFSAFLGIPYAEPPVDKLRFKAPVRARGWNGIRNATKYESDCFQLNAGNSLYSNIKTSKNYESGKRRDNDGGYVGKEDCLYLNVYTPDQARSNDKLYPVIIFIKDSSISNIMLGPHRFLRNDIVLVTFNYRTGYLGFMSSGLEDYPGNYGVKDQVLALKWVKENIRKFRGDPDSVTIFGQGEGAAYVHLHLLSSASEDFFHRAISESGNIITFWSEMENRFFRLYGKVLSKLEPEKQNFYEALDDFNPWKLSSIPALLAYAINFRPPHPRRLDVLAELKNVSDAFITTSPLLLLDRPIKKPWIIGINSGEHGEQVLQFANKTELFNVTPGNYKEILPFLLDYTSGPNGIPVTNAVVEKYFSNTEKNELLLSIIKALTDRYFIIPAIDSALHYKGPKYFYEYDHVNYFRSLENKLTGISYGASHYDELYSLFYDIAAASDFHSSADKKVSDQLIEYWVNFATYGTPNAPNSSLTKWDPVTGSGAVNYLHIKDGSLQMKDNLRKEFYELWSGLRNISEYESIPISFIENVEKQMESKLKISFSV